MNKKNNAEILSSIITGNDIAVDFGSENTRIYINGRGLALCEPSLIAIESRTKEIVAVGNEAKGMSGRNPASIKILQPIKNSVVADFDLATAMLKIFLKNSLKTSNFNKSKIIFSFPVGATEVEKATLHDIGVHVGGREISLICSAIAILLNEKIPVKTPKAHMILNIGASHTEVAVCSYGELITYHSEREGGNYIDENLVRYMKVKHNLNVSKSTGEEIKIKIASAFITENEFMEVRGRDVLDNLPRAITISSDEIRPCICDSINSVTRSIAKTCESLSAEISADILNGSIIATGDGANLKGLGEFILDNLGLKTIVTKEPQSAIANGMSKVFELEK